MSIQNAAIQLPNGIKIRNLEMLKQYFDFEILYNIIMDDPMQVLWFLEALKPKEKIAVGSHFEQLLKYFNMPECYMEVLSEGTGKPGKGEYPWWKYRSGEAVLDEERFLDHMSMIYQADARFHKTDQYGLSTAEPRAEFPNFIQYGESLRMPVRRLTKSGERKFSGAEALRFTLLFYLHLQAGKVEIPEDAVAFMEQELRAESGSSFESSQAILKGCKEDSQDGRGNELVISKNTDACDLPFYTGKEEQSAALSLVKIMNPSDRPKQVRLQGTHMERVVREHGELWVLKKGTLFAGFLPRFVVSDDTVVHPEQGALTFETKENEAYSLKLNHRPVCWADCNRYGTFAVNEQGKLETEKLYEQIVLPQKPVVGVAAAGVDFCMVLKDGKILSGIRKRGWDNILFASITLNGGLAITAERNVVDASGSKLKVKNIVSVDCYESHYLCIDCRGRIYTDSHLKLDDSTIVLAGAVYEKGYLISVGQEIAAYDFCNHLVESRKVPVKVTELYADGETAAYHDDNIGYFRFF